MVRTFLSVVALTTFAFAQSRPIEPGSLPASAGRYVSASRVWSIVAPTGWRQLTPDEAKRLRDERTGLVPDDLLHPFPGIDYCLGPVPEWLAGRCDGASLSVHESDHEPLLDEGMLADLRTSLVDQATHAGVKLEIVELVLTTRGPDRHPVAQARLRLQLVPNGPFYRTLEIYAPTANRLVALRFRAPESAWGELAPRLESSLDSVTFAQPPTTTKSETRGSKILWAALLGALAGLVLVQVRKHARAR